MRRSGTNKAPQCVYLIVQCSDSTVPIVLMLNKQYIVTIRSIKHTYIVTFQPFYVSLMPIGKNNHNHMMII